MSYFISFFSPHPIVKYTLRKTLKARKKTSIFGFIYFFERYFSWHGHLSITFLAHSMKYRLHDAVATGDKAEVQRALKGYDAHRWINAPCPSQDYLSPLHIACERQDKHIVKLLLRNGADVHQTLPVEACKCSPDHLDTMDDLYAPIHFAIETSVGDCGILDVLLSHGADVNHPLRDGSTPLHLAIQANDKRLVAVIKYLLRKGARVNCRHGSGFTTPLEDSYRCEFSDITDLLSVRCQQCGTIATRKCPLFACPCERHKYCSRECQSNDTFHAKICDKFYKLERPRFQIGQKVKCVMLAEDNMTHILREGVVVRHWYNQEDFRKYEYMPYQVRLDCGFLVYAPSDTNQDIMVNDGKDEDLRTLPQFQPFRRLYVAKLKTKRMRKVCHLCPHYVMPPPVDETDSLGAECIQDADKENAVVAKIFSKYRTE